MELRVGQDGRLPIPKGWSASHYEGGCNTRCDALVGPCACGDSHDGTEWWVQEFLQYYRDTIVFEQPEITPMPVEQIEPGNIVCFKADERSQFHRMTAGEITGEMVQVYWFTKENELRIGSVPKSTLHKVA